ncbi:hypothetical protein IC582_004150 [Cucumis melo]
MEVVAVIAVKDEALVEFPSIDCRLSFFVCIHLSFLLQYEMIRSSKSHAMGIF